MASKTNFQRLGKDSQVLLSYAEMIEGLSHPVVAPWQEAIRLYGEYWQWADGTVWQEIDKYAVTKKDEPKPLIFPIQINPVYTAALIHKYALFGEVPDSGAPLVKPVTAPKYLADLDEKVSPGGDYKESGKRKMGRALAAEVDEILESVMYQSNSRSAMQENAFVSQVLGGCVWKISWEPYNDALNRDMPIAWRPIEPEFFLPIYSTQDRFYLLGARLGRVISRYEAREIYGIDSSADRVLYLEKWDRDKVEVTVDGKPAFYRHPKTNVRVALSVRHGFGFVPFVYLPHETVGQFYGVPIVYQASALLREINGRAADIGDAVRNSIERIYVVSNCDVGDIQYKNLGDGISILSTGREIPGSQPKRIDVAPVAGLPAGTGDFLNFLEKQAWHAMFTPGVAYGEDEGSQRSALTLAFRMWPLTSHIRAERSVWTEGLRVMANMTLRMLKIKGETDGKIRKVTDDHLEHRINWEWAAIVPRDRESEVNQVILRHQDGQLSTETAMEMMGDIPDQGEELRRIMSEKEQELALMQKYTPSPTGNSTQKSKGDLETDEQKPVAKVEVE